MRVQAGAERVFVDTNVLVYVYDPDAMAKQTCARNLVICLLYTSDACRRRG